MKDRDYAAIDLGSNSFHMIVVRELESGALQILDRHKEMVRLREGLEPDGSIRQDVAQRALECLARFGQLVRHLPHHQVRAVGTNTLRLAGLAGDFLKQAGQALGHPIQIISGQEEARLIYLGVNKDLPEYAQRKLVMDIGGGSTEYIIGEGAETLHLTSTEMGCVSMTQGFFADGKITEKRMSNAVLAAKRLLLPYVKALKSQGWQLALGASGSIKAVEKILVSQGWSPQGITPEGLKALRQNLLLAGELQAVVLEGLSDERRPVLLGGVVILLATFELLKLELMQVSQNALREGLIYDTLGRFHQEDTRERAIEHLIAWTQPDLTQAQRAANLSETLLKQLQAAYGFEHSIFDLDRIVRWAGLLHEIGHRINHRKIRQHSAYLIENAELSGFTQEEQSYLATFVRNYRSKPETNLFSNQESSDKSASFAALICFRLAIRLLRGREDGPDRFQIAIDDAQITFWIDQAWLEARPLTQLDLAREQGYLSLLGYQLDWRLFPRLA